MGLSFNVDTPTNGKLHKSTVTVLDDAGEVITTDRLTLTDLTDRKRCAERLSKKLKRKAGTIEKQLDEAVRKVQTERRAKKDQKNEVMPNTVRLDCCRGTPQRQEFLRADFLRAFLRVGF